MDNTVKKPDTRKVAVIIADDFNSKEVTSVLDELKEKGVQPEILSNKLGEVKASDGKTLEVDYTFLTADSVLFDAVYAVGGNEEDKKFYNDPAYFISEAFNHFKPIGVTHEGTEWIKKLGFDKSSGVVIGDNINEFSNQFTEAIAAHRHWEREHFKRMKADSTPSVLGSAFLKIIKYKKLVSVKECLASTPNHLAHFNLLWRRHFDLRLGFSYFFIEGACNRSVDYILREKDYQGFVEGKGWAHAVAHGADLLTSVVVHPGTDSERLFPIYLEGIKTCIGQEDGVYTDNEDERLTGN